jgi:outer membrane receptor protein involved in Fe transport
MSNKLFRNTLLASTVIAGTAFAQPAFAQTEERAEAAQAASPEDEAGVTTNTDEEIVVTGTLIRNPNLESSSPVSVIGQDEIELQNANVAEELLRELPGAVPSIGSAVNNGNGGQSFVNLRGIGSNRNIVLLDGNRVVPGNLAGVVDLNNIPLALVERTEVLTGGASTTYGADAIGGVVNFITRQDFAGIEINVSEQITQEGDGNRLRADVSIGANFDDGRGNAVFSVGYQEVDPVYQGERFISVLNVDTYSGAVGGGSGTSTPSRFTGTRPLAGSTPSTTPAFSFAGFSTTANPGFDPTKPESLTNPRFVPILASVPGGLANGAQRQINAAGAAVAPFSAFNFNPDNIFQTPFERFNMFGQARYEAADGIELYTRGLFSKNTVETIVAPSGSFGSSVTIPLSNPFLPAALRNQFCALNVAPTITGVNAAGTSVSGQVEYTPFLTPAQCAAAATATSPTDPNFRTVTTNLSRRTVEVGPRISEYVSTVFDIRAGVRGDITSSIGFDVNGSYGESENTQTLQGYVLTSRLRSALFATNANTCLTGAPGGADITAGSGCVPINVFGPPGSIQPEAIPYITGESTTTVATSVAQARAVISGDVGFVSPLANDSIGFATGVEYRNYRARQRSDTLAQTPGELGGSGGAAPNIEGGYDVREVFGELVVPLIQDRPFFEELTLEAGVRYSVYNVDAPGNPEFKTTTYKFGGTWEPGAGLKIRGTYARAVRAPNIGELFSPVSTGLTNLSTDPCATIKADLSGPNGRPTPSGTLRAVCLAQGATTNNIASINDPTSGQANATGGGNVNLRPEVADTYTVGAVFQPEFVPGLTVAVDYFNIKVNGAVSSPTPGDAITACFGSDPFNPPAGAENSEACTLIRRNPVTGALDGDSATTPGLFLSLSNLGKIYNDGVDLTVNYRRDVTFAKLMFNFVGTYNRNSRFQASPSAIDRDCVGFYSVNCGSLQPKYQFSQRTTLSFEDIDLSLLWRYIHKMKQEPLDAEEGGAFYNGVVTGFGQQDLGTIDARSYFDLSARFSVTEEMTLTLSVENILNSKPPLVGASAGSTTYNSGNTFPSTYDSLGRRFGANLRLRF